MLKLVVLISGRGSNLEAIQKNIETGILQGLAKIELVISNKAEAQGLVFAKEHGLNTFVNKEEPAIIAEIEKIAPDVICLAGFMRILSPVFVKKFSGKLLISILRFYRSSPVCIFMSELSKLKKNSLAVPCILLTKVWIRAGSFNRL